MSDELRGRLLLLKKECLTIGQVPPHPNTLRAALGGVFVSVMQRLMFWYAPPVQRTVGGLIQVVDDALAEEARQRNAVEERLREVRALDEQVQGLRRQHDEMQARLKDLAQGLEQERATTIDLESNQNEQADAFQQLQVELQAMRGELGQKPRAERLRRHLPALAEAKARTVLDLDGGGAWLELLRSEGYSARAAEGDALEYLAGVPDASVSAVTAFRLAEQLPPRRLARLLDEIARVLEPGGVTILEWRAGE